ncbi:MAG TPA: histone deacetylase [Nitrospirales bacterium]|nr:histone deacetylase [Nitrospiraceae bacterium]HNP28376.1 histone deacetylase [Nitrospirales bacterium]
MGRVGYVSHPTYGLHDMGRNHPESPERLQAIRAHLEGSGTWSRLHQVVPDRAERKWIECVHTASYVETLERRSPSSGYVSLDPDTSMCPETLNAAYLAVGGALTAVDAIMLGDLDQAFCAVRPPGHHAEADRAMGFCFFNTVAIATRYLQKKYGLQKIMIVDWDVHHGNGTQQAFYDDPTVLFFSTHQYPFYPGTGLATETGEGPGKGLTINVPLSGGQGDKEYQEIFQKILVPAAERFQPECIVISAGFDGHRDDPLASMELTEQGYADMTTIVSKIAKKFAGGRIVSCLEGGYHLKALAGSVDYHLQALLDT